MTIKHLVISGGGPSGILAYGIASRLEKKDFWRLQNIKSIYGCSVGAYMGVIFSLGYAWEWLDDYFIKRPWEKLLVASTTHIVDIYKKKCLINEHFFIEAITPLLRAKDLKETVTLKELYDYNHIEIHMYATNINEKRLEKIDISYKSHPDLSVITALRMSMAFPIIFEPIFVGDGCYIDGGLMNNFPLNDCLSQQECEPDEILAFKNIWQNSQRSVNERSTIFDFLLVMMKKMQASIDTEPVQVKTKHTVDCIIDDLASLEKWSETMKSEELRRNIIERGYVQADAFLLKVTSNDDGTNDTICNDTICNDTICNEEPVLNDPISSD